MSKLMRRIWSVLIAVAMCVTMLPLNAFALDGNANTMVATFDQISALVGETVKVNVTLKNNPGITSFKLAVKWDADFLTLEGIDYNSSLGGMSIPLYSMGTRNPKCRFERCICNPEFQGC